jgi:5-formyltetrahydrofolate cyclo-ligase
MGETRDPDDDEYGGSPPCFLHELGPDGAVVDAQQAKDVGRWRKAERLRLIALRCALPAEVRALLTAALVRKLDEMISASSNGIVSAYWPIRAEPDLRPWMREAC